MPNARATGFARFRLRLFLILPALLLGAVLTLPAQSYNVVYSFNPASNGAFYPSAGVTLDRAGNLYGTTYSGGFGISCNQGCGTVYRLRRSGSSWLFTPLYSFRGASDGAHPTSRVVFGPDGALYGTTFLGGLFPDDCCGLVYRLQPPLRPPPNLLASWTESVLYDFVGGNDGQTPGGGDLTFDQSGNIYGTTTNGGGGICPGQGCGTVYQLAHSGSGWSERVLHAFNEVGDGEEPYGGVALDAAGNLYGTTLVGGIHNKGVVYQVWPSGSGWTEQLLYIFDGASDGSGLFSTPVFDRAGNLYATTSSAGPSGGGSVFVMNQSENWSFNLLHPFSGEEEQGPLSGLLMDSAGNLYGTTYQEGTFDQGSVFKLTPNGGGGWTFTTLHNFCQGGPPCTDGSNPQGILSIDASGNIYGTASQGGIYGGGVVFEISPQ